MNKRRAFMGRGKAPLAAGFLLVSALAVLCPPSGRAQTMVRNEPALHPGATRESTVDASTGTDLSDLPSPQSPTDLTGVSPRAGDLGGTNVIDLTGGREGIVTTERTHWRPIFYLNTTLAYNDNIFIRPEKVGDFVTTFEPGIILAAGDFRDALPRLGRFPHVFETPPDPLTSPERYVYLDYHPTIYLFAKNGGQNAVDESVDLLGGYSFPKLLLEGEVQYRKLSSEDFDAGERVDRDLYTADLTSMYTYSDKTSLEFNFYVNDREYPDPFVSSTELLNRDYLDYQYGPKTTVAAGLAVGHVSYNTDASQTYEQFLLRVTRTQLAKIDFSLSGGIDYRENSSASDMVTGVFDLSATFQPFDGTSLSFLSSRGIEPSAFRNDVVTYTRVGLAVQQRLLNRIYLLAHASYANADYKGVSGTNAVSRKDNAEELDLSVEADVTRYAALQLNYVFRNDASTTGDRTFDQNIVSVQFQITY